MFYRGGVIRKEEVVNLQLELTLSGGMTMLEFTRVKVVDTEGILLGEEFSYEIAW